MTEPEEFPPVTLKADAKVGVYFLCAESDTDEVRDCLKADEVKFSLNLSAGAHLVEAGKVLFAFGQVHPRWVAGVLEAIGEEVRLDPAVVLPEDTYQPPVAALLSLGEENFGPATDYRAQGISLRDVPALIRMATDELLYEGPEDSPVVFAPIHAWKALVQLRAEGAIAPLVGLFRRVDELDDWVSETLPQDLAEFGAAALEPLTRQLADATHGDWSRLAAAKTMELMAKTHPELRMNCVTRLSAQLERFPEQSEVLNGFLVAPLWNLKAVEAMPVIERAFASGRVDESINGDMEDMQIELGLKTQREHPRKPNELTRMGDQLRAAWLKTGLPLPTEAEMSAALAGGPEDEPENELPEWNDAPPA